MGGSSARRLCSDRPQLSLPRRFRNLLRRRPQVDRVAIAVFLHKRLCLQSANRCVLCPVFVVAALAGGGNLAPDRRCCFRRGDFLVAKGGDTRPDPKIIVLAGLSADTPALTW